MEPAPQAAPEVVGLPPDDAARVCLALSLDVSIDNQWQVDWWGWESPTARVVEQWPHPGSPTTAVRVRVGFGGGADGAGVREPRRPSPPVRSRGAEPDDHGDADT
ncbi:MULTISPECIES: hypothetical protein [unclassified Geodermatophilus]|uniref:hypothetical protein n=1 Tax=unclassified Geodermatophilus TaxID=2637632 RepID=UPI003EEFD672